MIGSHSSRACGLVALACSALVTAGGPEGGETFDDAVPIDAMPFTGVGDTSDNLDDFDVTCPYSGSTSPDVFYRYEAPGVEELLVDLCESGYDTKVYVLDATTLDVIACDDDGLKIPECNPFTSYVRVLLEPGRPVLIGIDGWGGDSGPYVAEMSSEPAPPPCVDCPDGTLDEGEPCADDGSVDTNGGCNSTPEPLWFDVDCGDVICGEAWALNGTRDTDWYRFTGDDPARVQATLTASFDAALFLVPCDCDTTCITVGDVGAACSTTIASTCDFGAPPTFLSIFVASAQFDLLPCGEAIGNGYVLSVECLDECPPPPCPGLGDLDGNGYVEFDDLLTLLANWGPCPG